MSVILQYQKQFKLKKTTKSKKYLGTTMSIILQYQKIQKYKKYLKILSPTEKQPKHSQFRKKHKIQNIPGTPKVCNSTLSKSLPILKKTQNPKNTWKSQCL